MPYIKERKDINVALEPLFAHMGIVDGVQRNVTIGDINYILTNILLEYAGDKPSYSMYNSLIGVLECCKLELYRRAVVPYEQFKINTNGDIRGYKKKKR